MKSDCTTHEAVHKFSIELMVVKVIIVVFSPLGEHGGTDALDSMFSKPIHVLPHLPVVRRRQRVTRMVTVPDDLHRQDTWVIVNLDKSFQRSLNLFVLFVNILGRDLPVGFGLRQVRLVDPRATLVAEISMHVISGPTNNNEDGKSGTALKAVLALHFLDELPYLMVDGTQAFSPFEAGVD
jgi:hypothetical protein